MNNQKERLEKKRAEIDAQLKAIKAREDKENRVKDTRKKVLIGVAILQLVNSGEWSEQQLLTILDKALDKDRDRELFGLGVALKKKDYG